MDNVLELYEHNIKIYKKIKQKLSVSNIAAIIQATGTGKTYNALQLAYDNKDKEIIYVVPLKGIIEHIKEIIDKNPNLDFKRNFSNLKLITYQSLVKKSEEELKLLDVDILIIDEFHHIGAPIWGARIKSIVKYHPNLKILGMSAYSVRDRGTVYERDMTDPYTNELFSNAVVSIYDLCDAFIDGVLLKPIYKSAYFCLENTLKEIEKQILKLDRNSKKFKELFKIINGVKKHSKPLNEKDVLKRNINKNGKYIYFCSPNSVKGINDIKSIMNDVKICLEEMGLTENDYIFYISTSKMGTEGKNNRKAFYNDEDLTGNKVDNKLQIMFTINQYNEGIHATGVNGVILGRETKSDIIFFEQIGRALTANGKKKSEYKKLLNKSLEQLLIICKERNIKIDPNFSKEEIIEKLLTPVIIDLAGNIDYIKELENNLKNKILEVKDKNMINHEKRTIHIKNSLFNLELINQDLYQILKYSLDRLNLSWNDYYELAKAYYEFYSNLEIKESFRTVNGYEFDRNGIRLGTWLSTQRKKRCSRTN